MTEGVKRRWSWLRRGEWVPLIPNPFRGVIMIAWVFLSIPYGIDYLSENPVRPNRLSSIESALSLSTWGWIMIVSGLTASVSLLMRWRLRTVLSLHVLGALWFTLSVGLAMDSFRHWGGDGYRSALLFFCVSVTYWAAALGYYIQDEEGVGENEALELEKDE